MSEFLSPEHSRKLEQYGIHLGVPIETNGLVSIPTEPYVFLVKDLLLYQEKVPLSAIDNVMVMHGHGLVLGMKEQDWVWRGTNKSVSDTVKAYEDVARIMNWPHVDIILACRDNSAVQSKGARVLLTRRPDISYIYADSIVSQENFPGDRRLALEQGVTMTVSANRWIGIGAWQNFREPLQRNRLIPLWAKMPSTN